uniref:Uncharacterized protein n=1 Tax=Kalanchoe fedtschenkoi TaxID=63787 RepID=A0A7N0V2X8_KALFE
MSPENPPDKNLWEQALRRMLPAGAPLPDEEHLDYSIAVEYQGPQVPYDLPSIQPLDIHSHSIPTSSLLSTADLPSSIPVSVPIDVNVSKIRRVRDCGGGFASPGSQRLDAESESRAQVESPGGETDNDADGANMVAEERRAAVVTFDTAGLSDGGDSRTSGGEKDSPGAWGRGKKVSRRGACSRCGKGNRLREKEVCLVCAARYCRDCLLKAMGSMPEGRKCVTCIGQPIEESMRSSLGKCSRMLSKVCSPLEVKQIMKAERECLANQLRPEQLVVNGRQLRLEELEELLSCPMPPQKLKPGKYWYDKDSGLWGKEGDKPDEIVTSKLNIGGKLQPDASSGNTKVFINGREITKVELRVLKLANVQCPRETHFWVYDDGSYEEEGQNNIKGNIWGKASTRLICSLLSLPIPPAYPLAGNDRPTKSNSRSIMYSEQGRVQKLLLFGSKGSGTSTIFKQAKFLYGNGFSQDELQNIKVIIQSNLYRYISILLEGREQFEEEALINMCTTEENGGSSSGETSVEDNRKCIYSLNPRFKSFSDWLLDLMVTGDLDLFFPAATREYAPLVGEIWKDASIQETYKRREELDSLPDVAKYFLDRAVEISSNEYEATDKDILFAEGVTKSNGLAFFEFSFGNESPMLEMYNGNYDCPPPLTKYELIRVNANGLSDGCRWFDMFEDVRAVIFCVSLSDYAQFSSLDGGPVRNKMLLSRDLFETLARHPCFTETPFVLLLNKYDVLEEKICKRPLTVCGWFSDFDPVKPHSNSQSLANQAYYYVAMKFKSLYYSITGRKLFVWQTKARERSSVDEALKYVREVVKWDEEKNLNVYELNGDSSFYSAEMSSSPYIRQE